MSPKEQEMVTYDVGAIETQGSPQNPSSRRSDGGVFGTEVGLRFWSAENAYVKPLIRATYLCWGNL